MNKKTTIMKNNKVIKNCLIATVALSMVFTSCKKREAEETEQNDTMNVQAEDSQLQTAATDEAYNDADNSANASRQIAGNPTTANPITCTWPCDATVDSSQINQGIITLTFNGSGCSGKVRTGQMKFTLANYANGSRWKDVGAQLDINFINFKVTRNSKSVVINGTHHLVNETGGLLSDLGPEKASIVRTVNSNDMSITFDDNSTRNWTVSKRRTWEYNGGNTKLSVTGEANGTNRKGTVFTTKTASAVVCLKSCGWHRPVSGIVTHDVDGKNATVTLGTDGNGNPDPENCPGYFKVDCTGKKGKQHEKVIAYK
jgi:hypothetical protein